LGWEIADALDSLFEKKVERSLQRAGTTIWRENKQRELHGPKTRSLLQFHGNHKAMKNGSITEFPKGQADLQQNHPVPQREARATPRAISAQDILSCITGRSCKLGAKMPS
jgi:hypothetical protein